MVVQVCKRANDPSQAWATCFLQSNSYLLRLDNSIIAIIAVSKVLAQGYWVHTIAMTCCVLCRKFTERTPISASVKLTISRCIISESVKWSIVCIAYNPLIPNQYRIVGKKRNQRIFQGSPDVVRRSSGPCEQTETRCMAVALQLPRTSFE